MTGPRMAWCSGCGELQLVDRHWLAFYVDSDGDLVSTQPERGCDLDYEREGTVFACGQGSALIVFERFLHTHSLEVIAQTINPARRNTRPPYNQQHLSEIAL